MPLGSIHLVLTVADHDHEKDAEFFCRIHDAIAAIPPERLADFPEDAICADCLRAYRKGDAASE